MLVPAVGAAVQVNWRTGGAATVYQAATGASTHSNPLTSDAHGRIEGWLDEGPYDLVVSGSGITTYTQRFEAVRAFKGFDLGSEALRGQVVPSLEVAGTGNPILGGQAGTGTSIYWPSVINTETAPEPLKSAAIEKYHMYYSTDHETGKIFLATAASSLGPWKKRNADGTLVGAAGDPLGVNGTAVIDDGDGETPSVLIVADDPDGRYLYLYYHKTIAGGQATHLATSSNWLAFTLEASKLTLYGDSTAGRIFQHAADEFETDASHHAGYFQPFYDGQGYRAIAVWGGGTRHGYALFHSHNGRNWAVDPRPLRYNSHLLADPLETELSLTRGGPIMWHGQRWLVCARNNFASGVEAVVGRLVAAPLADDLRSIIGEPVVLLEPTAAWETDELRSARLFTDADGVTYVYAHFGRFGGSANYTDARIAVYRLVSATLPPKPLTPVSGTVARQKGRNGEILRLGRCRRERDLEVLDDTTALPSWLQSTGTVSFLKTNDATRGAVKVATAASINALAKIETAAQFDTAKFKAIYFTVESLAFDTDAAGKFETWLGIHGPDNVQQIGALLFQNATEAESSVRHLRGLTDDFSTDTIGSGAWTFDAGSGTLSVSGGELVPSDLTAKRLHRTNESYGDQTNRFKITTGATVSGIEVVVIARWLDDSNYLRMRLAATGGLLRIDKVDGGAASVLTSVAHTLAPNTSYWFRFAAKGDVLTAEIFTEAPVLTSVPVSPPCQHTLTGANKTKFGAGITGRPALQVTPAVTTERYDDFVVEAEEKSAIHYSPRNPARRNLTLALYPPEQALGVYQDDQELTYIRNVLMKQGLVRPRIQIRTIEAVAHHFEASAIRLAVEHN